MGLNQSESTRFIEFPEFLDDEERASLLEKARYETFRERGASTGAAIAAAVATILIISIAIALAVLVLGMPAFSNTSPVLKAVVIALLAAAANFSSTLVVQYYRARLINRKIREITE